MTEKYGTLDSLAGLWGMQVWHASNQTTIVVSRISSGKRDRLSSTLSISTSYHGHGRTQLLISHVCVSGEADLRPWLVLMNKEPKSQHVVDFQTLETRQLPFIRRRVRHIRSCHLFVEVWRHITVVFWVQGKWRHYLGYGRNPNSKVMPRREHREEKKKLLLWMNQHFELW